MGSAIKDELGDQFLGQLARALAREVPGLDAETFRAAVAAPPWDELELKARIRHVARAFQEYLPGDYAARLRILERIATPFRGIPSLVFPTFVELQGAEPARLQDWELSMRALEKFTSLCSSEFAVRPFLVADPERTLARMRAWCEHDDEHVRRLASEGCRPRLPWASALSELKRDPEPILPILGALLDDSSEYVRRSVANNLNDISKDHPRLVLEIAKRWLAGERGSPGSPRWRLVKHGCRTLLKRGDERTLALFGFGAPDHVHVRELVVEPSELTIGGELEFRFVLEADEPLGRLRLEYALNYVTSRRAPSRKVFQLSTFTSNERRREVRRRHGFQNRSTRTHQPGSHLLEVLVNGRAKASVAFQLHAPD